MSYLMNNRFIIPVNFHLNLIVFIDQWFETITHSAKNLLCLNDSLFLCSFDLFLHCLLLPVHLIKLGILVLLFYCFIHQLINLLYFLLFLFRFIYVLFSLLILIFIMVGCYYLFIFMYFIILYFKNCFCFVNVNWKFSSKSRFYFIIDLITYYLFLAADLMIFIIIALLLYSN